jgi:hypothetical protein
MNEYVLYSLLIKKTSIAKEMKLWFIVYMIHAQALLNKMGILALKEGFLLIPLFCAKSPFLKLKSSIMFYQYLPSLVFQFQMKM